MFALYQRWISDKANKGFINAVFVFFLNDFLAFQSLNQCKLIVFKPNILQLSIDVHASN